MAEGSLAGIRVIDVTTVVLGPFASQVLGDMGADVIKVETLDGDSTRLIGPSRTPNMGSYFATLNRNKRSLALDLKKPAAKAALVAVMQHTNRAAAMISIANLMAQFLPERHFWKHNTEKAVTLPVRIGPILA